MRRAGRRDVPLRSSLLVRLLAVSVFVVACAVGATAWLVSNTTTAGIRQAQGQSLADDAHIYDTLVAYGARHASWRGVAPTVAGLARRTGRRIVLTTARRQPIASSERRVARATLPPTASATVDPLAVDPALIPNAAADRIDRRAVGPFALPPKEHTLLDALAQRTVACLRARGAAVRILHDPSGRPRVDVLRPAQAEPATAAAPVADAAAAGAELYGCPSTPFAIVTPTEAHALARLEQLTETCMRRRSGGTGAGRAEPIALALDADGTPVAPKQSGERGVAACLTTARRRQLRAYVAPAALLFVSSPGGVASTSLDLSPANRLRIVEVAALVLLVTLLVTVLASRRLVHPLHAVTVAAQRMKDGGDAVRVDVAGNDEIGRLAAAFNEMATRREQLERQRTAMVSDVAHELRTPVSNIRGWLEATEDGLATPDPAFVASLLEEARLLQRLIDDLQDLSAADAGELRLHPEPLAVRDVLEQVASAHRPRAEAAAVTVGVVGDRGLALTADPVRLRQAVGNLLSNAIRHSRPGGTVVVRAVQDGRDVVVDVVDEGSGIRPEDLEHVFDRFWRAEKSRSRETGGSGLGLAIVRKLVEAHGGSASVTSVLGHGAMFTLRFPASGPPFGDV